MAGRVGRRVQETIGQFDLPTIDAPQYVNEEGYEVDAETFGLALQQTEQLATLPADGAHAPNALETGTGETMDVIDGDAVDEAVGADNEMVVEGEPLLDLADRYSNRPSASTSG